MFISILTLVILIATCIAIGSLLMVLMLILLAANADYMGHTSPAEGQNDD